MTPRPIGTVFSLLLCSAFLTVLAPRCAAAQSSSSAPASATATATAKPAPDSAGFSIETEMLTYRALESNGEAIACDVASYLYNTRTDFRKDGTGSLCNVQKTGSTAIGVIVLPFDRSVFSDFQLWRSDMQTMAEFESRGASACEAPPAATTTTPPAATSTTPPAEPGRPQGRGLTASSPVSTALGMLPGGNMVSAAAGVLGLFAQDHASAPVGGTIQDQAFMDNVSRELRTLDIGVLMPSVYTPYGMDSIDATRSPFLISLDKLLHTRDCIVRARSADDPDAKSIDAFLAVLSGANSGTPTPAKAAAAPAASPTTPGATLPAPAAQPAPSGPSHLESVLSADGLAQKLGADPATGKIPDTAPQHLLLIKALESGGSVIRNSNIFGTRMSYSGGSVGTYALFGLDGSLECSGNVYDYAGPVQSKDFQKNLHAYAPDPGAQVIFQRGTCRAH